MDLLDIFSENTCETSELSEEDEDENNISQTKKGNSICLILLQDNNTGKHGLECLGRNLEVAVTSFY